MEELDSYLDGTVGSDPRLLRELLQRLTKERDEIRQQLSGEVVSGGGAVSKWRNVVVDVNATLSELETLKSTCSELCGGRGDVGSLVSSEVGECADELRERAQQLLEVNHLLSYLTWLQRIMELNSRIEVQLSPGGVVSEAVRCHGELGSLVEQLQSSQCGHLVEYATSSLQTWGDRLKEKIVTDYSAVLSELNWPFSSSSSHSLDTCDEQKQTFSNLFTLLLKLDPHCPPGGILSEEKNLHVPLILPLEHLVQPLRKRFRYHFMGERRTNCLEKPEWYLTQLSTWIRDHTHFLEQRVQPLLDAADLADIDALVEFTRGLLQEAEMKLRHDLQDIVQDNVLMAHLVDELLLFSRELTLHGYPPSLPSPLSVLLDKVPLQKWLAMEKEFAEERLTKLTASPTAWSPVYESAADTDDTRVPEAAEGILCLITGITDRYRILPSALHQLKFVELQKELLMEFHHTLATSSERLVYQEGNPLYPQFCAHLNASGYIATVLKAWGEMEFFVSLHYHTQDHTLSPAHSTHPVQRPDIDTIMQLRRQDSEFAELQGNVFSSTSAAFRTLCGNLQDTLVQCVLNTFRTGCKRYRKESWHLPERDTETLWQEVSPSLSPLLPLLCQQLTFLQQHVAVTMFPSVFHRIANHIDQILFTEVVLPTHFGVGGANQLNSDLTAGFLPVLSHFCEDLLARQLMERTREACQLLQLLPGSAKLLQELLVCVVRGGTTTPLDTYSAAVTTLNEFGVHTLEPALAHQILSNMLVQT